ncbi:conjugal transfer protein TraO [Flavobacterium psychrophilum]|uniref:conjugal transfer protein TraO n=1 Tax=Flavobacterium psychrophilum TaxID=96345 RepID=UPI00106CF80C|nr:conjugal transfer protein TraO [Flavobacterium psychrophilum]
MKQIILTCALLISALSFAQQKTSSLSFLGGITEKKGLGFMANYTYSTNNSNYEFALIHSLFKDENFENNPINYSNTTLNVGYLNTVVRNTNNSIALNLGVGVIGGYESVPKQNEPIIVNSKSGFIAGAYAVIQTDFYISDTFSIIVRAQENYLAISTSGKFNPYLAGGVKFNL